MRPLILITNDDGIDSPGLAAVAAAVFHLGDLLIVAPKEQQSSMGRSFPKLFDGRLFQTTISANGQTWPAYGANASPAQCVQHALLEVADRRPALVISGINYGENVGVSILASGTVGAAWEAAEFGIPAMAVSMEVDISQHFNNDTSVDFNAATHITRLFAERWMYADRLPDVDVLKIDIPAGATPETSWRITRLERRPYFEPLAPQRTRLEDAGRVGYRFAPRDNFTPGSDADAITRGEISVTPISLDTTSRIAAEALAKALDQPERQPTASED